MDFLIGLLEYNEGVSYRIIFSVVGAGILLVWLSLVVFVWCDSRKYFRSFFVRLFFLLITLLFGFAGLFIYILFKGFSSSSPDVFDENASLCPKCSSVNHFENKYCVKCGNKIFQSCKNCKSELGLTDQYCWNCGNHLPEIQDKKLSNVKNNIEKGSILVYIKSSILSFFGRGFSVFKKLKSSKRSK